MPATRDDVAADIRRVADELGRPPTNQEYNDLGEWSDTTIWRLFDGFRAAREAAGVGHPPPTGGPTSWDEADLRSALRRAADEMGEPLLSTEYADWRHETDAAEPSSGAIAHHWGSWYDALDAVGIQPSDAAREAKQRSEPPDTDAAAAPGRGWYDEEDLIDALQSAASDVGEPLTRADYERWRREQDDRYPGSATIAQGRFFDRWTDALDAAGVEYHVGKYEKPDLLDALRRKADQLGRPPTTTEVQSDDDLPSVSSYQTHFQSFNAALEAAGLESRTSSRPATAEIVAAIRDLASEHGHPPTAAEVAHADQCPALETILDQFGTYSGAVAAAGFDPTATGPSDRPPGELGDEWPIDVVWTEDFDLGAARHAVRADRMVIEVNGSPMALTTDTAATTTTGADADPLSFAGFIPATTEFGDRLWLALLGGEVRAPHGRPALEVTALLDAAAAGHVELRPTAATGGP